MLEAFVLYHTMVVNASRLVMNDLDMTLLPRMKSFLELGFHVKYRANWRLEEELPGLSPANELYAFEPLAESTCMWEHRLSARWVQILHAVDNFFFPTCKGCNYSKVLSRINESVVSVIMVPMVEAFTPEVAVPLDGLNVLQRYPLIGPDTERKAKVRQTPIANPRHFDSTAIHRFVGMRASARGVVDEDASYTAGLQTVHIMAIARPERDLHSGTNDSWYAELGYQLQDALCAFQARYK